jgi:hypothetical protein
LTSAVATACCAKGEKALKAGLTLPACCLGNAKTAKTGI